MTWIQNQIISLIFAAIPIGAIAFIVVQYAKKASTWIDGLPAWAKQSTVAVTSLLLTSLFAWAKVPAVCAEGINCLTQLDLKTVKTLLEAILSAGVAFIIHANKKK